MPTLEEDPESQPVAKPAAPHIGRTPSDAVVELVRMSGKLAPAIILLSSIAATFLVSQEQYREQVQTAQKELRESYATLSEINKAQLERIQSSLTVYDELEKRRGELERRLKALADEAEKARAFMEEYKEVVKKLDDAQTVEAERERLRADLRSKDQEIQALRERDTTLRELADLVVRNGTSFDHADEELVEKAKRLRSPTPDSALAELREFLDPSSSKTDLTALIGLSEESLSGIVAETDAVSTWINLKRVGAARELLGFGSAAEGGVERFARITVDGGIVTQVSTAADIVVVETSNVDDLAELNHYLVTVPFDDNAFWFDEPVPVEGDEWKPSSVFRFGGETEVVRGPDSSERVMSAAAFLAAFGTRYHGLDAQWGLALELGTTKRATTLRRQDLSIPANRGAPVDLIESLQTLLFAAATRDLPTANGLVAEHVRTDAIGRIGAAVLDPGFTILSIERERSDDSEQTKQSASAPEVWLVETEHGKGRKYSPPQRIMMVFERSQARFRLQQFVPMSIEGLMKAGK